MFDKQCSIQILENQKLENVIYMVQTRFNGERQLTPDVNWKQYKKSAKIKDRGKGPKTEYKVKKVVINRGEEVVIKLQKTR